MVASCIALLANNLQIIGKLGIGPAFEIVTTPLILKAFDVNQRFRSSFKAYSSPSEN